MVPTRSSLRLLLPLLTLLFGCPRRNRNTGADLESLLTRIDAAWEERDERGLEPVSLTVSLALESFPAEPEVRWREARLEVALGVRDLADPSSLEAFARARETALSCAASAGPNRNAECAAWGALGWAWWSWRFGRGPSAIDLPTIEALVERADRLGVRDLPVACARAVLAAPEGSELDLPPDPSVWQEAAGWASACDAFFVVPPTPVPPGEDLPTPAPPG